MATKSSIKLPVIDLSDLKRGTPEWESVKTQVRKALEDYGCFEASYGGIPPDLRNSVFHGVEQLFDLPLQTKLRNTSEKPPSGYYGQIPKVPLYESMGVGDVLTPGKVESFTNLLWPQGNSSFIEKMNTFVEKVSEMDKNVRRMVVESFELEKYMDEFINSTYYLLRFQKYDVPTIATATGTGGETQLGLASHTDMNCVTILYPNEVAGLEILTKEGEWIDASPSPNNFIVFSGDSFHAWTNGRLHSVEHKVMMKGKVARYSIGLFSVPKAGYVIKAPEELVDEEHPLLFNPYDLSKFMDHYYAGGHRAPLSILREYCGA